MGNAAVFWNPHVRVVAHAETGQSGGGANYACLCRPVFTDSSGSSRNTRTWNLTRCGELPITPDLRKQRGVSHYRRLKASSRLRLGPIVPGSAGRGTSILAHSRRSSSPRRAAVALKPGVLSTLAPVDTTKTGKNGLEYHVRSDSAGFAVLPTCIHF